MKTGIVAIIGRPNAGKSSLVNALVGEKVSIVSPKPQTTRERISGILNTERNGERIQIVLTDTPGIFKPRSLLDSGMSGSIRNAAAGADMIVYVIDGAKRGNSQRKDSGQWSVVSGQLKGTGNREQGTGIECHSSVCEESPAAQDKGQVHDNSQFTMHNVQLKDKTDTCPLEEKIPSIGGVSAERTGWPSDGNKTDVPSKDASDLAKYLKYGVPVIAAVNKCDIAAYEIMYPRLADLSKLRDLEIMPVSALKKINLDKLLDLIIAKLPEGEALYDTDDYTDKSLKFMTAEAVREKALYYLNDEIPHGIGVEIQSYADRPNSEITDVHADIVCEKDGHKQIIIGKGGDMIKRIGAAARLDLEKISGRKINLQLFVKVREGWRDSAAHVKNLTEDRK
ncbi:hypothetical protein FACS1894211_11300 [Clostridia bacterium]|nr:hypothetical protein FACS1894211_11300 [Clostridia bacterium]